MGGDVDEPPTPDAGRESATAWGIAADAPLVLYTGTFEAYQGVDLLIDAAAIVAAGASRRARAGRRRRAGAGGRRARRGPRERGAADVMVFTGQQPATRDPAFVQACDVLVSPRIRGTNTPLKIYSYLRSGKPIVATNLLTHTQVLTPEIARAGRTRRRSRSPTALAELLDDPDERAARCRRAAQRRGRGASTAASPTCARTRRRPTRRARSTAAPPARRTVGRGGREPR